MNGNKNSGLTEIGKHAVWSLSSAKAGNGVQQLRDNNLNTFWQSDGAQPHLVNIQFHKVLQVKQLTIYCNYKMDESYTPKVLSIRIGTHFHDLKEVQTLELEEPNGWVDIVLNSIDSDKKTSEGDDVEDNDDANEKQSNGIRTNMIQLAILSNHQNGRDTHLRQVKIYGPSTASTSMYVIIVVVFFVVVMKCFRV